MRDLLFEDYRAWEAYLASNRRRFDARWAFEQSLATLDADDLWCGYCPLCRQPVDFSFATRVAGQSPNLREELVCEGCRTNARIRAGMMLLDQHVARDAVIYMTEQASPAFVMFGRRHPRAKGSEYFADSMTRDRLEAYYRDLGGVGTIKSEDVTQLTFSDGSLDAVVSFDVLEHVPDFRAALREFARTLKPGGVLVLTAPFLGAQYDSIQRARVGRDGEIEHLLEPEYHGDPIGEHGILCFHHFGWDLLDRVREAGFAQARMTLPWNPSQGLMGWLWTLVARR